jgi:hypothetical protein
MSNLIKGNQYRGKYGEQHPLVYLGYNWSGNGYWHQFEKADEPGVIWCEVLTGALHMLEEIPASKGGGAS